MKAVITSVAVTVAATFALMQAFGANAPDRPPGVSADEWAPINDSVGVVLAGCGLSDGEAGAHLAAADCHRSG
jgi:hypothetical protein